MKGMILAAGLGTRLGDLTRDRPKALVSIDAKRSMLDWVIDRMQACGVQEFIINLHYRGDLIREHLRTRTGIHITYSEEQVILGTGGAIRNVEKFFQGESEFIVHNCDVYAEFDLKALIAAHRTTKASATLAVRDAKQDSYLVFDDSGLLIGWEMADGSKRDMVIPGTRGKLFCYTGIQVLSPSIFEAMRDEPPVFPITNTFVKAARAGQRVQAFDTGNSYWIDVGSPEKLEELRRRVAAA